MGAAVRHSQPIPDTSDYEGTRRLAAPGKCLVGTYLEEMSPQSACNVRAALADPFRCPSVDIARGMTKNGWPVSDHTVGKHRAGKCLCARS